MGERLTEVFMLLFCTKNSDGSKSLIMQGKEMFQRIKTRIKSNDMYKIVEFLKNHPEVVELNLSYNDIGDTGFNILIDEYLNDPHTLLDLNLMWCDITEKSIINLCSIPRITLRSIRLNGNKFGGIGGQRLAMLLAYTDTILHLDVGDTDQTVKSIPYFRKVLNFNYHLNNSLRVLDLSRIIPLSNQCQYDTGYVAEGLGVMLQFNTSLIEIHLQKNQFDGHDIELLLLGVRKNSTLLMLDLGYNRIADYGIEIIGNYIKTEPQLLGLNVAGNGITNVGARALSFTMPYSKIRLLDIGHNKITDKGMLDILNSIKKPYLMRMLNIWGNNFTHETNKVIQRMLIAKVLNQDYLDVKIYQVDNVFYNAYYPSSSSSCRYKQKYYCVTDYGFPLDLKHNDMSPCHIDKERYTVHKIKRNYIPCEKDKPRALVDFQFYPRLPPIEEKKCIHKKPSKGVLVYSDKCNCDLIDPNFMV